MTQPDPTTPPGRPAQAPPSAPPTYEALRPQDPGAAATPQYGQPAYGAPSYGAPAQPGAPAYPGASGYPGTPSYGAPQQAWAAEPTPKAPRGPAPFALISAALGLLALVLSFLPWISLRVDLGAAEAFVTDENRDLLNSTLDDLYANAWDLRWATRSVLLAVLAALLVAMPVVDRRLRGPWTLAAAVLASAGATVLMIIQIVNRSGIYGRALDVLSDLLNNDDVAETAGAGAGGASVSLALRWGAFATAAMVLAQFAVLVVLWLQSRPGADEDSAAAAADGSADASAEGQPRPIGAA